MFAELAARSHYSFLEGSASPKELIAAAGELGIGALGLCDRNGLYGAVSFVQAARAAGIHPVVGADLELVGGTRVRLLARDQHGYHQLCRAVSAAQLAGEKGRPRLRLDLGPRPSTAPEAAVEGDAGAREERAAPVEVPRLVESPPPSPPGPRPDRRRRRFPEPPRRAAALRPTAGPFPVGWPSLPDPRALGAAGPPAAVAAADLSGCIALAGGPGCAITEALVAGDRRGAARHADRLREAFGADRVALLLTHHLHPADAWLCAETAELARRCGLRACASNTPVHARVDDKPLLDVLTSIRWRTTLDAAAAHGLLLPNAEHRLKSERELRLLLHDHPQAFEAAEDLALQCSLALDFSDVRFPGFPVPQGETPFSVLYALCQEAMPRRYRPITSAVSGRLQKELGVIERTGLAEFFLIVHDIMRFARDNGIPGQGRGSAADSIVAYLLGITRVDPVAHDLLFERFLHEDHQGTPDIDIDFSTDHREQVIQYVYERYGAERTGMVANIVTFRPRMSVRQVGAALGFPEGIVDRLAKSVDAWFWGGVDEALAAAGLDAHVTAENQAVSVGVPDVAVTDGTNAEVNPTALPWRQLLEMCAAIEGTPRHLGIHVGGMLVTGAPLVEVAPVERATMPGRVVVQFNKDDVEDLGLIKMDLLGLRTLSAVAECLELVRRTTGESLDLDQLPLDDPAVYDMICAPDTIGMFQIESRAQQQSLYQSQPREFNDLIVQVAIIRPGPIQGNAVNPYLRRRMGLEEVTYQHPSLEPILAETRGVVLYQEQILRIVMEVAGYSAGEADRFRRAMNRHRTRLEMATLHDEFVERCGSHAGVPVAVAEDIFTSVAGFAQFGFCKSHAAAFARTAYETAWLRMRHPAAWLCSLLNAQPMGFYHPSVLIEDAKRHGVVSLPVDVTRSGGRCTLEWIGDGPAAEGTDPALVPAPRSLTHGERAARRAVDAAWRRDMAAERSPWAVRLGFGYVRGLGPTGRAACAEAAEAEATGSVAEFWRHTRLDRRAMENLVLLGAFDALAAGRSRRALLWELREAEDALPPRRRRPAPAAAPEPRSTLLPGDMATLALGIEPSDGATATPARPSSPISAPRGRAAMAGSRPGDAPRPPRDLAADPPPPLLTESALAPPLPGMDDRQLTAAEYRISELSTGPHLVAFLRPRLDALGCLSLRHAAERRDGSRVRVGGLVIARQAPMSAKGFRFFTLADEGGHMDLVLRPPVVQRTRAIANFHQLLLIDGTLQAENGRLNVIVEDIHALDGDGNLLDDETARMGGAADTVAPGPQHGFTRPVGAWGDPGAGDWTVPTSHDFH